jgi:ribosome-binding protein aMBF1 (putative translation factor)
MSERHKIWRKTVKNRATIADTSSTPASRTAGPGDTCRRKYDSHPVVGTAVRRCRLSQGPTQDQLAEKIGSSYTCISKAADNLPEAQICELILLNFQMPGPGAHCFD